LAELYSTGSNRVIYTAENFGTGKTVTAYFWNPSLVKSALQTFTEIELGLYYLDYSFASLGAYVGLFYENAVAKTTGVFRVTELASEAGGNIAAIKAKTDNLPSAMAKNVAKPNFAFYMVLATDHSTPATGKTVTAEISKDGAAFGACSNSAGEVGSGLYKISLTQAEMNADFIALKFTASGCDTRLVAFPTDT